MAKQIISITDRSVIVSMNYDPTGLAWVALFDNSALGWSVDDLDPSHPVPVMIGSLPPAAPDTAPVLSPQWAVYQAGYIVVPDVIRMLPSDFFEWLRSNNGAVRQVQSQMKYYDLVNAFGQWSGQ
jgi:hypothetical protein